MEASSAAWRVIADYLMESRDPMPAAGRAEAILARLARHEPPLRVVFADEADESAP